MTMTIPRAAFGVFAFLFTVATVDVSRAMAQKTTVTPTACGAGAITACGNEEIRKCEISWSFNLNVFMQSGGLSYTTSNCVTSGYRTLYKDNRTSTGGTGSSSGTCGGSTGSGLNGMRGSGDEEETPELCEG